MDLLASTLGMRSGTIATVGAALGRGLWALMLVFGAAVAVAAEDKGIDAPPPAGATDAIIARATLHMKAGEESFARGDFVHARTEFDAAMDEFLLANFDIRSDERLGAEYRNVLERIHRYQSIGVDAEGDTVWPLQAYEATRDDFRPEDVTATDLIAAAGAGFENATFLVRVAELQRRFREQFGRDFILTGRDTEVHARLYGRGHATDVRVIDLTTPQVQFIVSNARALKMRVLDFSSPDRVAAHNARVLSLGRPLDTLATGMHLHLNDLPGRSASFAAQPASKKRLTEK
jgi:hypothetical protein